MRFLPLFVVLAACATDSGANNGGGGGGTESGGGTVLMDLNPDPIVISDCDPGFTKSVDFTITAAGGGDLTLSEVRIVEDPSDALSFEELADAVIVAGESGTWPVSAALPDENAATGILRVRSDAEGMESVNVPICAFPTGWTGDTTCE
jgi:hypothetical protein